MKTLKFKITPEMVTELESHEIFVFGSNLSGNNLGGAAKLAFDKFGAQEGVGEGLRGQSYAFPTLTKKNAKKRFFRFGNIDKIAS